MDEIIIMKRGTGILSTIITSNKTFGPYCNIEVCRIDMEKRGFNPMDYDLSFVFSNSDKVIKFEEAEKIGDYYLIPEEDDFLYLKECKMEEVGTIGYIVFENGDEGKIKTRKHPLERHNEYRDQIFKTISHIMRDGNKSIKSVTYDENGHLCLHIPHSTAKIHICENSQLIDLNIERKSFGIRVLPFEKDMDKYLTFYIYTSFVSQERTTDMDKLNETLEMVIEYIKEDMSMLSSFSNANPRYRQVNYKGNIYLKVLG